MDSKLQLSPIQARIMVFFLSSVALFTAWDLFVDTDSGVDILHATVEGALILISTAGLYWVVRTWMNVANKEISLLNVKLNQTIADNSKLQIDLQKYKEETASYIQGLSLAIDRQFNEWKLTDSEKEVGLLLLKGLSHKEIAEVRGTSEKTVRHQSGSLYQKAQLQGRAQLAAFFLEDLLLPS